MTINWAIAMTNSKRWPKTTLGVAPQGEQWAFVAGALGLVVRLPQALRHGRPADDHVRSEKLRDGGLLDCLARRLMFRRDIKPGFPRCHPLNRGCGVDKGCGKSASLIVESEQQDT
jgi:hypothetical protein